MSKQIFSLVHFSDLHYSNPKLQKKDIFNKRILGYWNEALKKKYLNNAKRKIFYEKLVIYLSKNTCDLIIITGDFSNLSLNEEFSQAKKDIKFFFPNQKIITLAGNHDRYLKKTAKEERFEKYFGEYCLFHWIQREHKSIHTINIANKFQLVFFDMAVPNILSARGRLSKNFFTEYKQKILPKQSFQRIGFGHYPIGLSSEQKEIFYRRLKNTKKLEKQLMEDNFIAYFHGHIHKNWVRNFTLNNHSMQCVNTAGVILDKNSKVSFCHKMDLFNNGDWNIEPILK